MTRKRDLEGDFRRALHASDGVALPAPVEQYRFAAHAVGGPGKGVRKRLTEAGLKDWRFDFAWPDLKVAVELEGGTWVRGRHTRPMGFEGDAWKYNVAQLMGWVVLRYTGDMLDRHTQHVLAHLRRALSLQEGRPYDDHYIPQIPLPPQSVRGVAGRRAKQKVRATNARRRTTRRKGRALHVLPEDTAQ